MGLMPAKCHRKMEPKPYTRKATKVVKKAFVRGIPGSKIHVFDMGNKKKRDWKWQIDMVAEESLQLRHNQLEAARVTINAYLTKKVTKPLFYFKFRAHPHHIMRENPLATGAGADRFQRGMRQSFGKPVGYAARVKAGSNILSIFLDDLKYLPDVKQALRLASNKMSGTHRVEVKEFGKLI
ncbi:MAG TPA: 50S ribosomal protein L16 [archaeon]|nr:50S ribosomal protein L16 [archaeon]